MWCRKTDKLPWGYDFCFLPESRKIFWIAGHQVVRTRSVGAFQKYIVIGISCRFKLPGRAEEVRVQGEVVQVSQKDDRHGAHVRFKGMDVDTELAIARFQGRHVAQIAAKLCAR